MRVSFSASFPTTTMAAPPFESTWDGLRKALEWDSLPGAETPRAAAVLKIGVQLVRLQADADRFFQQMANYSLERKNLKPLAAAEGTWNNLKYTGFGEGATFKPEQRALLFNSFKAYVAEVIATVKP